MKILITDPGEVGCSQESLQGYGNGYRSSENRVSVLDGKTLVLDVRLAIVAPSRVRIGSLCIVEGHTRFYEAARRRVGIEAELVAKSGDLDSCPDECFRSFSLEHCKRNLTRLDQYQKMAIEAGVSCVRDMLKKR